MARRRGPEVACVAQSTRRETRRGSAKCRTPSREPGRRSAKCRTPSGEPGRRSAKCRTPSGELGRRSAKCRTPSGELGRGSAKCRTPSTAPGTRVCSAQEGSRVVRLTFRFAQSACRGARTWLGRMQRGSGSAAPRVLRDAERLRCWAGERPAAGEGGTMIRHVSRVRGIVTPACKRSNTVPGARAVAGRRARWCGVRPAFCALVL